MHPGITAISPIGLDSRSRQRSWGKCADNSAIFCASPRWVDIALVQTKFHQVATAHSATRSNSRSSIHNRGYPGVTETSASQAKLPDSAHHNQGSDPLTSFLAGRNVAKTSRSVIAGRPNNGATSFLAREAKGGTSEIHTDSRAASELILILSMREGIM